MDQTGDLVATNHAACHHDCIQTASKIVRAYLTLKPRHYGSMRINTLLRHSKGSVDRLGQNDF